MKKLLYYVTQMAIANKDQSRDAAIGEAWLRCQELAAYKYALTWHHSCAVPVPAFLQK